MIEIRLPGPVLNLTTPSFGRANKPAFRAHYEEKVKSFAQKAMEVCGTSRVDDGFIGLDIDIHSTHYEEPIGVAKAIMDALNCTIYRDDSQVRTLSIWWYESTESYVDVTAYREYHTGNREKTRGEELLDLRVPGTPVGKGLPYTRAVDVVLPEPDTELISLLRRDEVISGDVNVDFCITSTEGFNDPDNIVRYYLGAMKAAGVLRDTRVVAMYITAMDRNPGEGDEVAIAVYHPDRGQDL